MQTSNKKFPLYALTTLGFTFLTLLVAASPNWFQQMDEAIYHIKWQVECTTFNSGQSVSKDSANWNAAILLIIDGIPFTQKEKILAFGLSVTY